MSARRQRAGFRPAAAPARTAAPNRRQSVLLVVALVAVAAAVTIASFAVRPSTARAFNLFYGSVFVNDNTAPVAIDLASGKPSVRLTNAYTQVGARASGDLDVVPLDGGTLLLDTATGEFNMLDSAGFVLKANNGGVSLPNAGQTTGAAAIAAGAAAYIVRNTSSGTSVYLVNQSTVSSAANGSATQARASVSMTQPASDLATGAVTALPGDSTSANSDLWLLVGSGATRVISQLSVPPGTNAGAQLQRRDHGTVSGVAAMAVTTRNADGSGGDLVAVASADGIDVFDGTNQVGHVAVAAPAGVDAILPASNQQGSFAFLYHSASAGWSLVRAGSEAPASATVLPLTALTGTDLAAPAESDGALYTMDRRSGALWQITLSGGVRPNPTITNYPLLPGETPSFEQASVLARGSRVIFNSRTNLEALTVFTDGSHGPVVIDKRTAVDLSSNGVAALASQHVPQHPSPSNSPKPGQPQSSPTPNPAEPVTDRIDCSNTTQIPHIPNVQLVGKGSRSAQIQWTYPLLDRQDCAPSTYTVSVQLVGGDAPSPPGTITVQGVTGVNITGLFPDTQYRVVVSAYINGRHTPSAPLLVRTQVEGPAAPTGLTVSSDDKGNWQLSWNSCGGVAQGCVPVDSWTIIPQLCDSSGGLIGAPPNGQLVGDPTTHTFTYTYRGGDNLLGYGLNFSVEGVGDHGTVGRPETNSDCVHSWAHPNPSAIHVAASTPPHTVQGGTSSTTVNVTFDGDPNVALGGVGGTLTYRLLSGGSLVQQKGPTSATSVSLAGVQPGSAYQVQVIAAPPGHPTASVALPPVDVQAAIADWPSLSVAASFTASSATSATGALTVAISGLASSDARGETFDLANSQLVCGNTAMPLNAANFDPAQPLTFSRIDRSVYNGSCTVQIALQENPSTVRSPAYFGGTSSPESSTTVQVPVPALDTSAAQFSANFVDTGVLGTPEIAVSYQGSNGLLATYATGWSIQAQYADSSGTWIACGGASSGNPARAPVTLTMAAPCYYANHSQPWRVTIDFSYFGQSPNPPYEVSATGTGPQPVDPNNIQFATQGTYSNGQITATYTSSYPDSTLASLNWVETISSDAQGSCGPSANIPPSNGQLVLSVDTAACPPTSTSTPTPTPTPTGSGSAAPPSGSAAPSPTPVVTPTTYTVTITFTDPNYGTTKTYTVKASGS